MNAYQFDFELGGQVRTLHFGTLQQHFYSHEHPKDADGKPGKPLTMGEYGNIFRVIEVDSETGQEMPRLKQPDEFTSTEVIDLIYTGLKAGVYVRTRKEPDFDRIDVMLWVDELPPAQLTTLMLQSIYKLTDKQPAAQPPVTSTEAA